MTRSIVAAILFAAGTVASVAAAQAQWSIFVPHGDRVVGVPLEPAAPAAPASPQGAMTVPAVPPEWGLLRFDGLPSGAGLAINGRPVAAAAGSISVALPPGPHVVDLSLPSAPALRVTVVVPTESSGYQVVPKP